MQKRPLQDVIPPADRPIRPSRTRRSIRESLSPVDSQEQKKLLRPKRNGIRFRTWLLALVAVVVVSLALSLLFSGSRLVVVPKQRDIRAEAQFQAVKNPGLGELGFEVMSIERIASETVSAGGEEEVSEKASGKIVIFNNHGSASQRLIKNTRLETPEGLTYRIPNSIVVPGKQKENGEIVPGSIEVEVFADEAGEKYNIGLTDFTIPGFKGTQRFNTFYARSKTQMTGGFEGIRKVVSEKDRTDALKSLRSSLAKKLTDAAGTQKPSDFILYGNTTFINFDELPDEIVGSDVKVSLKATFYGVLLEEGNFGRFLASQTVAGYEGEPVEILDPASLSVTVPDKDTQRPWESGTFSFNISGNAKIIWIFDEIALKRDLSGKSKDALDTVLTGYPAIERAKAVVRPFWKGSFPEDPNAITIVRDLDG